MHTNLLCSAARPRLTSPRRTPTSTAASKQSLFLVTVNRSNTVRRSASNPDAREPRVNRSLPMGTLASPRGGLNRSNLKYYIHITQRNDDEMTTIDLTVVYRPICRPCVGIFYYHVYVITQCARP